MNVDRPDREIRHVVAAHHRLLLSDRAAACHRDASGRRDRSLERDAGRRGLNRQRIDSDRDIVLVVPLLDHERSAARDRSVGIDVSARSGIQREVVSAGGDRRVERDIRPRPGIRAIAVDQHVARQCDRIVQRDRSVRGEDVRRRCQRSEDLDPARPRTNIGRCRERRAIRRVDRDRITRRDRLRRRIGRGRCDGNIIGRQQSARRRDAACRRCHGNVVACRHGTADRRRTDAGHGHIGPGRECVRRVERRVSIGRNVPRGRRHRSRQVDAGTGRCQRHVAGSRHRSR